MQKIVRIAVLPLVFFAVVMAAGCMNSPTSSDKVSPVYLKDVSCDTGQYHWLYCSGYVMNSDSQPRSVTAYIEVYDKATGAKLDRLLIYEKVDAHGMNAFKITSTETEDYGVITYKCYVDDYY
jgi:hypothetical protein